MSTLVVGSVAYDTIETPFGKAERVLGGSASYFSVAASFFTPVRLVAVVGDDFGEAQLAAFRGRPIDLDGLELACVQVLCRRGGQCFWSAAVHEGGGCGAAL